MLKGLVAAALVAWFVVAMTQTASGQDGHYGHGHDGLHEKFYQNLQRNGFSCCNLNDCRPTQSRTSSGFYEVMLDGDWVRVPTETILRQQAPDGGAHVCAPKQAGPSKGQIYCVVLPPET